MVGSVEGRIPRKHSKSTTHGRVDKVIADSGELHPSRLCWATVCLTADKSGIDCSYRVSACKVFELRLMWSKSIGSIGGW